LAARDLQRLQLARSNLRPPVRVQILTVMTEGSPG
jgi:hypothetical protein